MEIQKSSVGPSLARGWRGRVLLFPGLQGIARMSGRTRWKGSSGRGETLPDSCQVTEMENKHLDHSDTQLDFKTNSGGKKVG